MNIFGQSPDDIFSDVAVNVVLNMVEWGLRSLMESLLHFI